MESQKLIKKLKAWLDQPGNSKPALAAELGYSCSSTIDQWLKRGRIPKWQVQRILEVIER